MSHSQYHGLLIGTSFFSRVYMSHSQYHGLLIGTIFSRVYMSQNHG